jgi:hypothetical protein
VPHGIKCHGAHRQTFGERMVSLRSGRDGLLPSPLPVSAGLACTTSGVGRHLYLRSGPELPQAVRPLGLSQHGASSPPFPYPSYLRSGSLTPFWPARWPSPKTPSSSQSDRPRPSGPRAPDAALPTRLPPASRVISASRSIPTRSPSPWGASPRWYRSSRRRRCRPGRLGRQCGAYRLGFRRLLRQQRFYGLPKLV